MKQKAFFIIFKELPFAKNCLRPDSASLNRYKDPKYYVYNITNTVYWF